MKILMVTNTFAPNVSGVARSVTTFTEEFRRRGHRVVVIAPKFDGAARGEADVIRVRALRNFNGTDYSVVLAPPHYVAKAVDALKPDVIHSHNPFLLGTTASRLAKSRNLPLVFTHHTLYERYTHYVPGGDSTLMKRLAVRRATKYANSSDAVFAPSKSIADLLYERGVTVPIFEVPTGVRLADFGDGDGAGFRADFRIPADATVVGYVGRIAEEKNLDFLARALSGVLARAPDTFAAIVGDGPSRDAMREIFRARGVADRVRFTGTLRDAALIAAYHALDVFAFASLTETQGLVLAEAMAAGVPVVALDAPGAREIVRDGANGRLLPAADEAAFAEAIDWIAGRSTTDRDALCAAARASAADFDLERVADRALSAYESVIDNPTRQIVVEGRRTRRFLRGNRRRVAAVSVGDALPHRRSDR
jgi:glycosyltransferase involved in cell wall biosynthesis